MMSIYDPFLALDTTCPEVSLLPARCHRESGWSGGPNIIYGVDADIGHFTAVRKDFLAIKLIVCQRKRRGGVAASRLLLVLC